MAEEGALIGGRYRILTQIGEGGMSRAYLALDSVLNKQWAAKEIKRVDDDVQRELIVQSLITESNMIKRFDHPAIPRIVDIVDEDGTLFVIMDYVEGRTLEEILKLEGPQAEDDVVDWAVQLCDVLDYLHTRTPPVIYRDMKPSNVMLKPNGLVQLIDFGIAREYREDGSEVSAAMGDTVQLGTRGFAPPEQYGGSGQTDARTDVYALGATLYYLITGKSPAEPPYTILPVRQVAPEVSPGFERIIAKATQSDPADRYQGCAEMAYDLEHYREADDAHRAQQRRKWHLFVGSCAAAAVCLVIGIGSTVAQQVTLSADFDHWMDVGAQSSDETEAIDAYARAAAIRPGATEPYVGMIDLFRADQDFSATEERALRESLLPQLSDFSHDENWAAMTFALGKLYWYSYNVGPADGSETAYDDGRAERIRAASQWMHDAASVDGFSDHDLAQTYADIADFNTDIVPLINEGSDAGSYAPYFERLSHLIDVLGSEQSDVVKLEVANLTLDAVRTYPRKFRAEGIDQASLEQLVDKAVALADTVSPTTSRLDAEAARVADDAQAARTAVAEAFVDVGGRQ